MSSKVEAWHKVEGVDHDVLVSNLGRVKNMTELKNGWLKSGRIFKNRMLGKYYAVILRVNKKPKTFLVHRLVAKAFIENPLRKPQVNHKDANKLNNSVDNLEWCTSKENVSHAIEMNITPYGEKVYNAKLSNQKALEVLELSKTISKSEIARRMKVSRTAIRHVIDGVSWKKTTRLKKEIV